MRASVCDLRTRVYMTCVCVCVLYVCVCVLYIFVHCVERVCVRVAYALYELCMLCWNALCMFCVRCLRICVYDLRSFCCMIVVCLVAC